MTPFKTSRLFDVTWNDPNPIIVHEGGTSSTKTYSLLQILLIKAITEENRVITITGQDIPNLKKGSYRDIQNIIAESDYCKYHLVKHHDTERVFTFRSGSIIEFTSYDNEQDAKNGKRDYLFVNEANGIPHAVFNALHERTSEKTYIDFNPSAEFWAHTKLKNRPDVSWYKSNFRHNPFIKPNVLATIIGYEPTPENIANGTADEWRWMVYGLGKLGRLQGAIFTNWEVAPFPTNYQWKVYGLDFGFTNDPTALIEIAYHNGEMWWRELIYENGLTNPDISKRMESLGLVKRHDEIVPDSAEPKSIKELEDFGWNVHPAVKGEDSIRSGIDMLKRYKLNIDPKSVNLIREFGNYKWATDRNGVPLNKPIDAFNHGIDGGRYATVHKLTPKPVMSVGGALV
jgi:phage terminase large subunit